MKYNSILILILSIFISVKYASTSKLGGHCTEDNDCTNERTGLQISKSSCANTMCTCDTNYNSVLSGNACGIFKLNAPCSSSATCAEGQICSSEGKCVCNLEGGYKNNDDNTGCDYSCQVNQFQSSYNSDTKTGTCSACDSPGTDEHVTQICNAASNTVTADDTTCESTEYASNGVQGSIYSFGSDVVCLAKKEVNSACTDGNECTSGKCVSGQCTAGPGYVGGSCSSTPDCKAGGPTVVTDVTCVNEVCTCPVSPIILSPNAAANGCVDITGPSVVGNAVSNAAGTQLTLTFNEDLQPNNNIGATNIKVKDTTANTEVSAVSASIGTDSKKLTFNIADALIHGRAYTVTIAAGTTLKDAAGNDIQTITDIAVSNSVPESTSCAAGKALFGGICVDCIVNDNQGQKTAIELDAGEYCPGGASPAARALCQKDTFRNQDDTQVNQCRLCTESAGITAGNTNDLTGRDESGCIATACGNGYRLGSGNDAGKCLINECTCANGNPVTDPDGYGTHVADSTCLTNEANVCDENGCDAGYGYVAASKSCTANDCFCNNGVSVTANGPSTSCVSDNDHTCASCNTHYVINTVDNTCVQCQGTTGASIVSNAVEVSSGDTGVCSATKCAAGFTESNGGCTACSGIANAETYGGNGLDSCLVTKCNENGFYVSGNACVACDKDNAVEHTSNGIGSASCVATKCEAGYKVSSGSCTACPKGTFDDTYTGDGVSTCIVASCKNSYIIDSGSCTACNLPGANANTYTSDGVSTCTIATCNANYELVGGACLDCVRDGAKASATNTEGTCIDTQCNADYYLNGNDCTLCNAADSINTATSVEDSENVQTTNDFASCTITSCAARYSETVDNDNGDSNNKKCTPSTITACNGNTPDLTGFNIASADCSSATTYDSTCSSITPSVGYNGGAITCGASGYVVTAATLLCPSDKYYDNTVNGCDVHNTNVNTCCKSKTVCGLKIDGVTSRESVAASDFADAKCSDCTNGASATGDSGNCACVASNGYLPNSDKSACAYCYPGSEISNGVCQECQNGFYSTSSFEGCKACSSRPSGPIANTATYGSHIGRDEETDCYVETCDTGFYKKNSVGGNYQACGECAYGSTTNGAEHLYKGVANNCPAGTSVNECDGSTTTDTSRCVSCTAGETYSTHKNSATCSSCTECSAGYVPEYACQPAFNTGTCSICDDSTYRVGTTSTQTSCTTCAIDGDNAVTYSTSVASGRDGLSDCTIASCATNYYLSNGACVVCSAACDPTRDEDNLGGQTLNLGCRAEYDRTCKDCGKCQKGELVQNYCTAKADTVCNVCPEGEYMPTANHRFSSCTACTTTEVPNAVEFTNANYDSDNLSSDNHLDANSCKAKTCAANYYLSNGACVACTSVSNGATTATADQGTTQASACKVTACDAGFYLDGNGRGGAGACVACEFGAGKLVAGKYCPAGSTSSEGSDCPAGKFNGANTNNGDAVNKCRPCTVPVAQDLTTDPQIPVRGEYVTAVCSASSDTVLASCTITECKENGESSTGWQTRSVCVPGVATGNGAVKGSDGVCRHNDDHCDYELGTGNLNDNVRATTAAANNMVSIASGAGSNEKEGDTLSHVCLEGFTGGSVTCSKAGKDENSAGYSIVKCTKVCEEGVKYYDKTNNGCGSGNVDDQSCCDACQGPSAGFYTTVICSEKANTITTAACKICGTDEYLTKVCVSGSNTQVGEISTCAKCKVCSDDGKTENVKCVSTETDDTSCKDCGQCTKGQFVKKACTDTSDTECDVCGEGTYQNADISSSVAKQGTTTCTACTETDGTALNAHTFTNDGYTDGNSNLPHIQASKCRAKTCKKGFQLKRNDAGQSLGECEACPAGTYQEVDGGINCEACPAGSVTNTLTNTGAHQCTICPAGKFSTDSSRACQACTGSTYLSDDGQDTTKHDHADDCTKCPAGTQNTEVGAAAHNDVSDCKICPRGMYNAVAGGNCGNCPAGTFLSDGTALVGTDASKHDHLDDCDDCPNNGFSLAGAHECSTHTQCGKQIDESSRLSGHSSTEAGSCDECDDGSYDPDGLETTDENYKGNQDCERHEVCGIQLAKDAGGKDVSRLNGASAISKGFCADCDAGTYGANGEANCAAHTVCGNQLAKDAGGKDVSRLSFASEAAKKTTAGSCDVCADNTYAVLGTDNCLANQNCGQQVGGTAGDRLTDATRTTKGSCNECATGTFDASVNNDQDCKSHHQCEKGEYVINSGSSTTDRTCATCGAHTYSDAVNSDSCTNCPAGSENLDAAQSAAAHDDVSDCSVCVAGEYSNAGGACVGCPKGTFNNKDNSAAANHAGIGACTICLAHQYADTVGSTVCTVCSSTDGDNPNQNGGQACTDALCGGNNGFANANAAAQCTACVAGKYGPVGQPCQDCQNDFSFFKAGDGTVLVTATTTVPGATSKEECSATQCIPGARLTGAQPNRCEKILCTANQYVENNVCKDCSYSKWAPAGSDPAGSDTSCFSGGNGVGDSSLPDQQGIEAVNPASGYEQKVIYSHVGSLHVNKYGYLVDLNGLLLVGKAEDGTTDENAKHHIHVPSRYNNVYFSQDGKAWVMELDGGHFQHVGTIMLARFENPLGLNKFRKITTYCIPESNEFGFMLGNWCENTWLDEFETQYMSESIISGPGIVAKPHTQGMGRISNGRSHRVSKAYRNIFATAPGWNLVVEGRGYFQYRYIMAKTARDSWKNDPSSHGDGSYDAAYKTTNPGEGHI